MSAPAPGEIIVSLPRPHSGQMRVLKDHARFNVLECGRRFGKTALGKILAAESAIDGHRVGWFAPTNKILGPATREIAELLRPVKSYSNKVEQRIELITGGHVEFWSLDNPDSGRSRKYHRLIVDEAGLVRDLNDAWNGTLRPTLTDYKGDAWFLGTPKGRNAFHRLFARGESGEPGWKSWRLPTTDNPHIDPEEIEDARRSMPEQAFAQEFLGVPADDGGNPFGIAAIRACIMPAQSEKPVAAWGIDLASSYDWTWAIGLDEDGREVRSERWQGPWEVTIDRIVTLVGGAPTLVDCTGVGAPVLEALQKRGRNFEGFVFNATSKQQLMGGVSVAIQRREVGIFDPVLVSELESFEYHFTRTGVTYGAPQGLHDDGVCALALAVRMLGNARPPGDHGVTI